MTPTETTETLAEFGIVFLLFALGLEFSLPRLIAMRGEVFTLGGLQVGGTTAAVAAVGWAIGLALPVAILLGGAVAMSSTAIVLRQLTEQDELNRTHGRLAFGVLLFQDLAIVPFLALAGVLGSPQEEYTTLQIALAVSKAAVALLIVLASGRWLLRPLFHEIAKSNSPELFTFAVLFVAIGAAWATHAVGLSFALGAFLAGMMLAETEYRYQVEAGIRPFRDTLLGLFFVTIGMQLDVPSLLRHLPVVIAILVGMLLLKAAIVMLAARPFAGEWFKSLRSGIVLSPGGEFGFALLALLLDNRLIGASFTQPLLAAITLSMLISPLLIRHNKSIARFVLRQSGPLQTGLDRLDAANQALARREHVILCGYGRVGQNVGRVLETEGFECLAMDLDPVRVRTALAAGDAVIYGDAADEGVLKSAGIEHALAVVVTFSDTARSLCDRARGAPPAPEPADPGARTGRYAPRGPARGRRHGSRAGDAGGRADAGVERAAHAAGAGLARHPHGRRDPPPALQGAALGDRPRSGRPRRRVGDLPRGAAHGGAAARRLVDRPDHPRDPQSRGRGVVHRGAARRHRGPRPGPGDDAARGRRGRAVRHARGPGARRGRPARRLEPRGRAPSYSQRGASPSRI